MEHVKIVRVMYAQTRKGRLLGIFQIAVCPVTVLAIVTYCNVKDFNSDIIAALCTISPILITILTVFGYVLGPPYISRRTMRKLLQHYFNY